MKIENGIDFELSLITPNLTKKEIEKNATQKAIELLESGNVEPIKIMAFIVKHKAYVDALDKEIRAKIQLSESTSIQGVQMSLKNTGDRLDYESDIVFKELSEKLKERGDLLKLAYKSKDVIFDSEGCEVPKIGVKTYGKDVLNVKF